jgi:hypothetical protein
VTTLVSPLWRQIGMGPATVQVTSGTPIMVNQDNLGAGVIITDLDGAVSMPQAAPIWAARIWLSDPTVLVVTPA